MPLLQSRFNPSIRQSLENPLNDINARNKSVNYPARYQPPSQPLIRQSLQQAAQNILSAGQNPQQSQQQRNLISKQLQYDLKNQQSQSLLTPQQPKGVNDSMNLDQIKMQVFKNQNLISSFLKNFDKKGEKNEDIEEQQMQKKLRRLQRDQQKIQSQMMQVAMVQMAAKNSQNSQNLEQDKAIKEKQLQLKKLEKELEQKQKQQQSYLQSPQQFVTAFHTPQYSGQYSQQQQQQYPTFSPQTGGFPIQQNPIQMAIPMTVEGYQQQQKLEEKRRKNEQDAKFLQELLNKPQKDFVNESVNQQQYQKLKKDIEENERSVDHLLKDLQIPKFNMEEEEKFIANLPIEIEQMEKERAKEDKKKLQLKEQYQNLIQNSESQEIRKGSKKFFKLIAKTVISTLRWFKESISNKIKERELKLKDLDDALLMYNDVAKGWIMKAIKKPLISMLQDPDLNLDFLDQSIDKEQRNNRLMKIKVRAKGIVQSVVDSTDAKNIPLPLVTFLSNLVKPKSFVPHNFLTEFELNRIYTDPYGAIIKLNEDQIKMIASMYLIGKVLIVKILYNPQKTGINMQFSDQILLNFKLLSTIIYNLFLEFIEYKTSNYRKQDDKKGNDGVSPHLYMVGGNKKLTYDDHQWVFRNEIFQLFELFLKKLYFLIANIEKLKDKFQK